MRTLGVVLAVGLLVTVTACDWARPAPTPTPTPPGDIPSGVMAARDTALDYLRQRYPNRVPPPGFTWRGRPTSPQGLVGASTYEFVGERWLMTVLVPLVSPDSMVYEMVLGNEHTGFRWTGKLDGSYRVLESNRNVVPQVLAVRDSILSYIEEYYPYQGPARGLVWVGERTTPEGSVGHESCQFAADDWTMTVDYDLVAPDQMVYHIQLWNTSTGFLCRCLLDAEGVVLEHR